MEGRLALFETLLAVNIVIHTFTLLVGLFRLSHISPYQRFTKIAWVALMISWVGILIRRIIWAAGISGLTGEFVGLVSSIGFLTFIYYSLKASKRNG